MATVEEDPLTLAGLFPGQGSQVPGMGRQLLSRYPTAAVVVDRASDAVGIDLRELMWHSSPDVLRLTQNAQIAIVVHSLACFEAWRSVAEAEITAACGHSMGSLAAAVVTGALELEEAALLARHRGEIMASAPGDGAMLAVSVPSESAREFAIGVAAQHELDIACYNGERQLVLAGPAREIHAVKEVFGAKSVTLQVSHAFHSRMMKPVEQVWVEAVSKVRFRNPVLQYISSRSGDFVDSHAGIADDIIGGLCEPVRWDFVSRSIPAQEWDRIAFGNGQSLARMWRGHADGREIRLVDDRFRG